MLIQQNLWTDGVWHTPLVETAAISPQLVMCFADNQLLSDRAWVLSLQAAFAVPVISCSTAGEIFGTAVLEGAATLLAIHFEHTRIQIEVEQVSDGSESEAAGERLARRLCGAELRHVLVLSEGSVVNGSRLASGLGAVLGPEVVISGGLAGDGDRFQQTRVFLGTDTSPGQINAVGFYGSRLCVGNGSLGGWDAFGPDRRITRSAGNVLHELDGQSALALYKTYLGEHAKGLPASALRFPLCIKRDPRADKGVLVRTILQIDEENDSMIFAGDMPEGWYARLMRANHERLIDGAGDAATASLVNPAEGRAPQLALLISCVGRRLVLQQRVEEEVEAVRDALGEQVAVAGFYSYGELAALDGGERCTLQNQTMTVTTYAEY